MTKHLTHTAIAVFTAATLFAGIASAEDHDQDRQCDRQGITFESLDIDGNGAITTAEIAEKAMEKFNAGDTDADGFLSADEMLAAGQARMARRIDNLFERRDENGDGLLSPEEMRPQNAGERFMRADTDGNDEVSEAEFDAAKEARGDRGPGHKKPGRGQGSCDDS